MVAEIVEALMSAVVELKTDLAD